MNLFIELLKQQKGGLPIDFAHLAHIIPKEIGNVKIPQSYWFAMTIDVIPNSRSMTYTRQKQLVEEKSAGLYGAPSTLEALVGIVAFYCKKGLVSFGTDPLTYTRCKETVTAHHWPVTLGNFSIEGGLSCSCSTRPNEKRYPFSQAFGMAAVRQF